MTALSKNWTLEERNRMRSVLEDFVKNVKKMDPHAPETWYSASKRFFSGLKVAMLSVSTIPKNNMFFFFLFFYLFGLFLGCTRSIIPSRRVLNSFDDAIPRYWSSSPQILCCLRCGESVQEFSVKWKNLTSSSPPPPFYFKVITGMRLATEKTFLTK